MSATSGTWQELIYSNVVAGGASNTSEFGELASFTSEASLLNGTGAANNSQPFLLAGFFNQGRRGQRLCVRAAGVLSVTGTPTFQFRLRFGTTAGFAFLTGTKLAGSAAITCQSGISNAMWEMRVEILCQVPGAGSGAMTLGTRGWIESPAGFASPFKYGMSQDDMSTPANWTTTLDGASNQYLNLTVACSANSASNKVSCKEFVVEGLN